MEASVNQQALKTIASVQWKNYAYSVIVVPGAGPSDADTALSAAGRRRAALAADAYHVGKAPFILVSGGYVHPSQTRFAEAIEMKKALLQDFHVPEATIILAPPTHGTLRQICATPFERFIDTIYRWISRRWSLVTLRR